MYNRKRIARAAGTTVATWALIGVLLMSTGVAFAVPLAGVGGFTVSASDVTADRMVLYPGVGDGGSSEDRAVSIIELENADLQEFGLSKDIDLDSVPGLGGLLRVQIQSTGPADGGNVFVRSTALEADSATFNDFLAHDLNGSDATQRFELRSDGPMTLEGPGRESFRMRTHYLAADEISLSGLSVQACFDPDGDGDFEFGSCAGYEPANETDGGSDGDGGDGSGDGGSDDGSDGDSGNTAPSATASGNRTIVGVGDPIAFDGSGSSDPDGVITAYEWDFGDGETRVGETVTHAYDSGGEFTATLTVTDDDGATDSATVAVSVEGNTQPTANATANRTTVGPGSPVAFDASGSSDPDGTITAYEWDFGDGTTATGATVTHSYESIGDYNATVTVTDDDGATATEAITISVTDRCSWFPYWC